MNKTIKEYLMEETATTISQMGHTGGFVVPVSGGSDSALVFWLLNQICPDRVIGVYGGRPENLREKEWFESIGRIEYLEIPEHPNLNVEASRWATFLSFSLKHNCCLVGSRNATENALGTYSLASRVATWLPLCQFFKTDVMESCEEVGIPSDILLSSKRADPECGRTPEMAAISIKTIDRFVCGMLPTHDPAYQYLSAIKKVNAWKRHLPLTGSDP